jgi:hypothetical protein
MGPDRIKRIVDFDCLLTHVRTVVADLWLYNECGMLDDVGCDDVGYVFLQVFWLPETTVET